MCGGGPKFTPPPPDPVAEAEKEARTQQIETQRQEAQAERSRDIPRQGYATSGKRGSLCGHVRLSLADLRSAWR